MVIHLQSAMQWWLGVARRIQALIFLLSHWLDASRHFLANFLVILNCIWHLNFTDFFRSESFALDSNNKPSPNLFFSSLIKYLTLRRVSPMHPASKTPRQLLRATSLPSVPNLTTFVYLVQSAEVPEVCVLCLEFQVWKSDSIRT